MAGCVGEIVAQCWRHAEWAPRALRLDDPSPPHPKLLSNPENRGAPRAPPVFGEYLRALDALARFVLCILELLLALADLLLGFALLLAELVVGQLALGLLDLAFELVTHAFHGDPFRLVFGHKVFFPV